jgi:2-polyprenyl-3-methyl-5-hydroxy-6-metoxy-1,4-benzoquinol methylase
MKKLCRICGGTCFPDELLSLDNMPKDAQGFFDHRGDIHNRSTTLKILQCERCGVVQLDADAVSYYRDVVRANAFSPAMANFRLQQLSDWAKKYSLSPTKKILEIGCGKGEYLQILETLGLTCVGLENAKDSAFYCKQQGLVVEQGFLDSEYQKLESSPFDAVVSFNFMEHWPDPIGVLRAIWCNLNPKAVGLIEVPNFEMILEKKLFSEFIPDHLYYYTKDTLQFVLQLGGFEIISIDTIWHDYILSAQVRKRAPLDLSNFISYKKQLIKEISHYVSQHKDGGIAIWGAGHQALAMICLAEIQNDIKYIVDSATFKQGKFSPASDLPVFSPAMLETSPVGAVIIMGAGYSDEILSILTTQLEFAGSIAVLRDTHIEIIS